jgi:uncharacterized protein (DUF697 family)
MQKLLKANVEQADQSDANAQRALKLKAAQDKAAQYLREQRYAEARRALNKAKNIQAEEVRCQRLTEMQAEREKALRLTNEGQYAEAGQSLQRADELAALVAGWKARTKRCFASARSRVLERPTFGRKAQTESAEQPVEERVKASSAFVSRYAKIAAGVCFMPLPFIDFAALMTVQVLLVRRIAHLFGQTATKEQIRGLVVSLVGSVIPTGVGQGVGATLSLSSLPVLVSGAVVYFVATPLLAYALTRAVGNVFIMHFESGGTLLTFDPKAFTEYFASEFKKAGGILRKANKPAPVASAPVA